jgi:hypothetical protein
MTNIIKFFKSLFERILATVGYIFPFMDVTVYYSNQVCYRSNDIGLKLMYVRHFYPMLVIYEKYVYIIFGLMIGIFLVCSRNKLPYLTEFVRFNIMQAILLDIVCSCIGQIYAACPTIFKFSIFGTLFANAAFIGTIFYIIYCIAIILLGRLPVVPIVSEAAKIHLKR